MTLYTNNNDPNVVLCPQPLCSNHDDGETAAAVQCLTCGNLCVDCDRILHLHRKTKHHQRQVKRQIDEQNVRYRVLESFIDG